MTVFTVAISAGHYPAARGAAYNGTYEYDETVPWQLLLAEKVNEFKGGDRHLYVTGKIIGTGKLPQKVAEINAIKGCDLAIEIHFNGAADPSVSGCETLYYPGSEAGLAAAKQIQIPLYTAMRNKNRGIKEGWYKMDRPGVVDFDGDQDGDEQPDYFLAKTDCTSLILEPDFMGQIENIRAKREQACVVICDSIYALAERKHELYNLPPESPGGMN